VALAPHGGAHVDAWCRAGGLELREGLAREGYVEDDVRRGAARRDGQDDAAALLGLGLGMVFA
jgi:hypothetical protein